MPAASLYEVILAVHIMAVVVAFGVTFAYPIMFAVAARADPRSLPVMHRVEYTIERFLINPGLLVVLAAGIYLASEGHHWSEFFVQWGLGAVVAIGAAVGAIMIPTAKRAETLAARAVAAQGDGPFETGPEYQALARRLSTVGALLSVLVLVTILFMVVKP
ncbi:MAG TPA: DUF2269 family protein [Solirubrobacteraceae bacterium]|jgi:uncharacterized membrane protein|nr:DUF2269 family protein [Solirubrobacteraceae bacterium]